MYIYIGTLCSNQEQWNHAISVTKLELENLEVLEDLNLSAVNKKKINTAWSHLYSNYEEM